MKINRQNKEGERAEREDSEQWEWVRFVVLGLNWLTQVGRCDVLPWVRGGGQWAMFRAWRLFSGILVCLYVFRHVVFSSSCCCFFNQTPLSSKRSSFTKYLPSATLSPPRLSLARTFYSAGVTGSPDWHLYKRVLNYLEEAFPHIHSLFLNWPPADGGVWRALVHFCFCFVYQFDHSCVKSKHWYCSSRARAETATPP